jgi:hypothetical protein
MKKSSFLCVLMAVALLSGCSKSELVGPAGIEAGQIALRSSITDVNASLTRAPYEGTDLAAKPLTALVLTSLSEKNYSDPHAKGTITFTGAGLTAYNKPLETGDGYFSEYSTAADKVHYLSGLYPATGWSVASGVATFPFTGKEDVMFAPEKETSYNGVASADPLTFAHQLTQLQLAITKDSELSSADIKLKGAKVLSSKEGLKSTAKVTLNSNQAVTFEDAVGSDEATGGIPFYKKTDDGTTFDETVGTTSSTVAYTLVNPDEIESGKINYTLYITYQDENGNTSPKKVDVTLTSNGEPSGLTAGYSYLITLNFKKGAIECKASVTAWHTGTSKDFNL